ncbi:MAG: AI-2E family transporter [Candidatus Buchananbacteria bacterium]
MSVQSKKITFDISSKAIFRILLVAVLLVFLYFIRDILVIVFVSLILASAFGPWVDGMQKVKIPRALGILFIFLGAFLLISFSIYLIIPPIAFELNDLIVNFPTYWEKFSSMFHNFSQFVDSKGLGDNLNNVLGSVQGSLGMFAGGFLGRIYSFVDGIFSIFMIIVLTFYFTVQDQYWKKGLQAFLPIKKRPYFIDLICRMQEKIGLWLRGQLILCLIIFFLSWLGLTLLGVKYAAVLALFTGIMEFIPFIGPFIAAVPAIFIALTQSPTLGLLVLILYIVIQQLENLIIVPNVMKKAVGLNPIVIIIVMLIGARLAGILGILLAVPVATATSVAIKDYIQYRNDKNAKADNQN